MKDVSDKKSNNDHIHQKDCRCNACNKARKFGWIIPIVGITVVILIIWKAFS